MSATEENHEDFTLIVNLEKKEWKEEKISYDQVVHLAFPNPPPGIVITYTVEYERFNHAKWECKYHVVFIPKYRRKALYTELRRHLGGVFRALTQQKESAVEEGHLMSDHVHMLISIPPKYAVAQVVGFIKGKSAIHLARVYGERKRSFVGQHFWARGYFVSTVGRDEATIREYIRAQEKEDARLEQLNLWR